jgi:hypothetical protein
MLAGGKELPMTEDVSSGFEGTLLTNGLVRIFLSEEKCCMCLDVGKRIFLSEEKCCMCLDVGKRNCSRETFRRKLFFISSFRRNKT